MLQPLYDVCLVRSLKVSESGPELKTIQEIISLSIFMGFSVLYLGEPLKWNYVVGFALIVAAAFIIFHEW